MFQTKIKNIYLITFVFLVFSVCANAQLTKIRGTVIDAESKLPLSYVYIVLSNTTVGTITDEQGIFSIETKAIADSIECSYVGYISQKHKINKHIYQELKIELVPDIINIKEVIVKPGNNPAHDILEKVIKNKKLNDVRNQKSFKYQAYNKVQIDLNNIDDQFRNRKIFKQFQFIFNYLDTNALTGKAYLPVLISETLSDMYYQSEPKNEKEIIKASNLSGLKNESVSQLTGRMTQSFNIYDNFMSYFDGGFISPISDLALLYYKYYLTDSAFRDNHWCYHITFKPKDKFSRAFTGNMWIADTVFAVQYIQMRLSTEANINFVNELATTINFSNFNNNVWAISDEEILLDFNVVEDSKTLKGFFGRKNATYYNYSFNTPIDHDILKLKADIVVNDSAFERDNNYWKSKRPIELSTKEENIYKMVDSIKNVPLYQTLADWINLFVNYYYVIGKYEFGPYYSIFSFNDLEGYRFRVGGRTGNAFSTRQMFDGYIAYGTKDEKIKYGIGYTYMLNKSPRKVFGIKYNDDLEQLGKSTTSFKQDNILSSVLRRSPNNKLTPYKQLSTYYEHEWYQGFSNTLNFLYKQIYPSDFIPFQKVLNTGAIVNYNRIISAEIYLKTHFAWNEKFIMGDFERMSIGTEFPILDFYVTGGLRDNEKSYLKLKLEINHYFETNPFGYFKYTIDAGKIIGNLPYPLLELHKGNETYSFDYNSFNLMNYYEFVSDQYITFFAEQHFQGFFLNNIPLLRKMKWREVASIRGLSGSLNNKNKNVLLFPENLTEVGKPYWETSVGVENIFKLVRVDAMWRLSHLDRPNVSKFGVRAMLQITF